MKERILEMLLSRKDQFVSGEEMSSLLGISRAGIGKHVTKLREEGYRIESQTRLGHCLHREHIPLNSFELKHKLPTKSLGCEFVVLPEVISTNDMAKELARNGAAAGTVVIAKRQTGGRGRLGREWVSPNGGIWMSIILRPRISLRDAAIYTLLTGAAAAAAINGVTALRSGIKWPNDILINGKKVGGVLTEVVGEWQSIDFLVIGIGINANLQWAQLPVGLEASSLEIEAGKPVELVRLIQTILCRLEELEQELLEGNREAVLNEWRKLAVCLNCAVTVKEHNNLWLGTSVDINSDGALVVKNAEGNLVKVYSGDVSLRSEAGNLVFKIQ
ncbi:MAG TPA: biotin--[acetyl-CoA-carboxylase] ligase [Verrucomicrobiae bacterium]|nr:biotin--[acetyl-CoA-carboxylase] ligase [Verrucomicrobiae bacterium]